jgi:Gpi18-like mannosyltransferase
MFSLFESLTPPAAFEVLMTFIGGFCSLKLLKLEVLRSLGATIKLLPALLILTILVVVLFLEKEAVFCC